MRTSRKGDRNGQKLTGIGGPQLSRSKILGKDRRRANLSGTRPEGPHLQLHLVASKSIMRQPQFLRLLKIPVMEG